MIELLDRREEGIHVDVKHRAPLPRARYLLGTVAGGSVHATMIQPAGRMTGETREGTSIVLIGAHVPVGDGLLHALEYAIETGCECMQIFAKNPRQWHSSPRDPDEAARFLAERARLGFGPVFTHAAYLINLGSDDPLLWERSWHALADEIRRADLVGASAVIVHAGTTYAGVHATPAGRVADAVVRAWAESGLGAVGPRVALENSAGAGRAFGARLEDLCEAAASALDAGVPAAVCFDTCHGFAAGIDISRPEGWSHVRDVVQVYLGADGLAAIHANDCKGELASHRDRHEWIGDGNIGSAGFEAMFGETGLGEVPVLVEMPGEAPLKDSENVERLRSLRASGAVRGAPDRGSGGPPPG
jgi:deoxyribonuclease-4